MTSTASTAQSGEEASESLDYIVCSNTTSLRSPSSSGLTSADVNSELSLEEVHHYLSQLLRENTELKDALQKNNRMMHEQLRTVAAWRAQLMQTNGDLKAALEEERKVNQKLREENEYVQQKNKEFESKVKAYENCQCVSECVVSKECNSTSNELKNSKTSLNGLEKDKNLQYESEKNAHGQNLVEVENLQSINKVLEEEKQELTALNNQLQYKLAILGVAEDFKDKYKEPTIFNDEESGYAIVINPDKPCEEEEVKDTELKDLLLSLREEQAKVSALTRELAVEKEKVASLEKVIKTENQKNMTTQAVPLGKPECNSGTQMHMEKEQIFSTENFIVATPIPLEKKKRERNSQRDLKNELEMTKSKVIEVAAFMNYFKDRCDILQQQNNELQKNVEHVKTADKTVIEKLQTDLKSLQDILQQEQATSHNEKINSTQSRLALAELSKDYKRVVNKLQTIRKNEDFAMEAESKQLKHMEQLDSLTAQLMNSEQQLEQQQLTIESLHKRISDYEKTCETIPILKAQVEVYKSDFEKEKKVTKTLEEKLSECEELMKTLQEQFLTEQTQHDRRPNSSSSHNTRIKKAVLRSNFEKEHKGKADGERLQCPRCFLVFHTYDALQNHVDSCIADDSYI